MVGWETRSFVLGMVAKNIDGAGILATEQNKKKQSENN